MFTTTIRRPAGALWGAILFAAVMQPVVPARAQAGTITNVSTDAQTSDANSTSESFTVSQQYKRNVSNPYSQTPCTFKVRFSCLTALDVGLGGSATTKVSNSQYDITFHVEQNGPWTLRIDESLVGKLLIKNGGGPGRAGIGPVTCATWLSGSGSGTLPGLEIALQETGAQPGNHDQPLTGTKTTTLSSSNPQDVILRFHWQAYAISDGNGFNGPEVGVRLGEADDLDGVTVGAYDSEASRLLDGHFVTVTLDACNAPPMHTVPALRSWAGALLVLFFGAGAATALCLRRRTRTA